MTTVDRLITQNNLEIDLFTMNMSDKDMECKTNSLINKKINKLSQKLNNKIVIYYQTNDTVSYIGYHILKIIQGIAPFKLFIYNKKSKCYKKEKRIFRFNKIKKLLNKNAVLITANNLILQDTSYPLHKVEKTKQFYKKINLLEKIELMKDFNPKELIIASNFYKIDNVDLPTDFLLNNYSIAPIEKLSDKDINSFFPLNTKLNNIYCLWLSGDLQEDTQLINQIESTKDLVFYYYKDEVPPILYSGFEYWLKSSANQPVNNVNVNIYEDLSKIKIYGKIYLLGNFPQEIINQICSNGQYQSNIIEVIGG